MTADPRISHQESPLVVITDDERAMRDALRDLLESVGLRVALFGRGSQFA